jgi:metal-responsive CopG/Arc/MetJ family transcriptional regulator
MSGPSRIGVAIDASLEKFDRRTAQRGYTNRSEAFRDLIRDGLVRDEAEAPASQVIGTVTSATAIMYGVYTRNSPAVSTTIGTRFLPLFTYT